MNLSTGAAWLKHERQEYRLVPASEYESLNLPEVFAKEFSVWAEETGLGKYRGILAAHDNQGKPFPAYFIDYAGSIRPLNGDRELRLSMAKHHAETEIFSRWGLNKRMLLVWLNDDNQVKEVHIPFNNGENSFTRMIRTEEGNWLLDGLEVQLESIETPIPAFAGYPIYLVGKNKEGQQILLLSSVTPYEMADRKGRWNFKESWNQILTEGTEDKIYQYKIGPAGQIEGLTVADNLLLLLWKIFMGHYAAAAELAKRWLIPPGRPYTKEEENLLHCFIAFGAFDTPLNREVHPSAISLRAYCLLRIFRHLQNYPISAGSEKMSKFAKLVIGQREDSYSTHEMIMKELSDRGVFGRQIQGTQFDDIFSLYDHETLIRLPFEDKKTGTPLAIDLYKKLHSIPRSKKDEGALLSCSIHSRKTEPWKIRHDQSILEKIQKKYPTVAQSRTVPIKQLYRSIIPTALINFFDKAYTLIKEGPKNPEEQEEYDAIKHALAKLYTDEAQDICLQYYSSFTGRFSEKIDTKNIYLWLLLHVADELKTKGKELPELPSIQNRFGLTLKESHISTETFFNTLIELKGQTAEQIYTDYFTWLFAKRSQRYIKSRIRDVIPSHDFDTFLYAKWSSLLTLQLNKWKDLREKAKPPSRIEICLADWPYTTPKNWAATPLDRGALLSLQGQVQARLNVLVQERSDKEKELLSSANALPQNKNEQLAELARQIHYVTPCSIDECIGLALMANFEKWQKRCPNAVPAILQYQTVSYLTAALEAAHIQRIEKGLKLCLEDIQDTDRFGQLQELLSMEIRYLPSTANLPIMASEYYADCRLRNKPDQAELIEILTGETDGFKGSVIQAIMGSGKSKKIAPIWLQMMLGKWPCAILCVPGSLAATTLSDFQTMMWDRFKTHVRALQFHRESCDAAKLHLLAESFYISQSEPTVFICTPRDLHALQLMLKERHQICHDMRERLLSYAVLWAENADFPGMEAKMECIQSLKTGNWENALKIAPAGFSRWYESHAKLEKELQPIVEESNLLQAILNLIQYQVPLLVDEVASIYDPKNLLSFPLGWQVQANPHAAEAACMLYFDWLPEFYGKLGLLNNMQSYSSAKDRQEVYDAIARKAWENYRTFLEDLPALAHFRAFLQSDPESGKPMAHYIENLAKDQSSLRRNLAQEICFLKFALTSGLEGALTSVGHVNYGRSRQDANLHLAIPYECANKPKENTLFKSPWKTLLMTCQYYAQEWKDPRQTAEMICFLQGIDEAGKERDILEAAAIVWGKNYGDADASDSKAMNLLTTMLDQARLIPGKEKAARLLIRRYLQSCVFGAQLKLDPAQMTSSPQDIPMMAAKADAMGGTFGFENTWNPKLKRVADTSCNTSIEAALKEPRNQLCRIMPKGGAEAFFRTLEKDPQILHGYVALIDTGACFKGISNQDVAKRLLHSLPEFDSILFWNEENQGSARLAVMTKAGKTLLEHSDKNGVKQALSRMKLKTPFAYYDQARRIGADLDLPNGKALVTFTDIVTKDDLYQSVMRCRKLLDGRHSVAYAIPAEMGLDWTAEKVIRTAKLQQRRVKQKANYPAICEQLQAAARAIIDQSMRCTADPKQRDNIYLSASHLLIERQENDLVKAFGRLQQMVPGKKALESLVQRLVESMNEIIPAKTQELENTLKHILQWHEDRGTVIPELVREGEGLEDAVQEVDLSKDLDRMRLMEEEYERMHGARIPKQEIAWTNFSTKSLTHALPIGSFAVEEGMPGIHSLKAALAERGFNVPFPSNILISSNLLYTFEGEANCLLTANQKPVHRGLFILGSKQQPHYILVSEGDAYYLKEHLYNANVKGLWLVEPRGAINQRTKADQSTLVTNLWEEGSLSERTLLFCALVFQGAAVILDKLPKVEVKSVIQVLIKGREDEIIKLRMLLEAALDLNPDEMLHYRRSPKLRALFMGKATL